MTKSIFITATGTDIGKTYISGLLVKKLRETNYNCGYYKPVLSGMIREGNKLIPMDCKHVVETSGLNIEPINCLSYSFEEAVSPHLAAKRAGIEIDINKILNDYNKLSDNYDYMIIEGAGGVTCPIKEETYLMWNLIKDLNTDVVIVADGGLGTINSVLTTYEYLKNRKINIKGFILNNFEPNNFMHIDNQQMIEKMTGIKVIITVEKNEKSIKADNQTIRNLFL